MCVISRMCHGFIILTSESLKTEHVKNAKIDVKWKLLSFGNGEENRRFIVASPDWPDRFLYLSSAKKYVTCRKNRKIDPQNIEKGLWKILKVKPDTSNEQ